MSEQILAAVAKQPLKVMIAGPPAAGKGTQCARIVENVSPQWLKRPSQKSLKDRGEPAKTGCLHVESVVLKAKGRSRNINDCWVGIEQKLLSTVTLVFLRCLLLIEFALAVWFHGVTPVCSQR